jgi:hypothetical protein
MLGSLALVGSGEFLPIMADFEKSLIDDGVNNGKEKRYVQIPTPHKMITTSASPTAKKPPAFASPQPMAPFSAASLPWLFTPTKKEFPRP